VTIKKIAIIASLLITGSCLCCGAQAAQLGTYVGGGVGYSKRDFDKASLMSNRDFLLSQLAYTVTEQGPSSTEDTGIGYWATLGYRATAHWAFEGTYSKLSSLQYKSEATQGYSTRPDFSTNPPTPVAFPGPASTKFDIEDDALQIDALYILPRGYRWEFYGRAGFAIATTKVEAKIDEPASSVGHKAELSSSSNTYHAGIGFTYSLLEVYGVRVEYDHTFAIGGNVVGGEHDVDTITLGVIVAF
jgi:opacity protein-like surface antigen